MLLLLLIQHKLMEILNLKLLLLQLNWLLFRFLCKLWYHNSWLILFLLLMLSKNILLVLLWLLIIINLLFLNTFNINCLIKIVHLFNTNILKGLVLNLYTTLVRILIPVFLKDNKWVWYTVKRMFHYKLGIITILSIVLS